MITLYSYVSVTHILYIQEVVLVLKKAGGTSS